MAPRNTSDVLATSPALSLSDLEKVLLPLVADDDGLGWTWARGFFLLVEEDGDRARERERERGRETERERGREVERARVEGAREPALVLVREGDRDWEGARDGER
ncbi:hypothetical protein VPNG_00973 [Cytospora leucostoma]|uniref:Uncharacterized protein n=1 Tax=Cytospora leucostoma TaxID=1230097 RepID=A0A423XMM5_9PEZI|nr:hypothetical protein VPNG_00973 [Cytospora leucostoma]